MRQFSFETGVEALTVLSSKLMAVGSAVAPRGLMTHEFTDVTLQIHDVTDTLALNAGRKLNPDIAVAEALQLIGGFSDPGKMASIAPEFKKFMDGGVFHGGYGTRTQGQFERVIHRLQSDPDTRQAIATIWAAPQDLFLEGKKDYPCTLSFSFRIRDDQLTMKTHMRSNDIWRGFSYDVFQFTMLQQSVANVLGIECGAYVHHVDSLHLYETDFHKVEEMFEFQSNPSWQRNVIRTHGIGDELPAVTWSEIERRAYQIFYGQPKFIMTDTESWMNERTCEWSE